VLSAGHSDADVDIALTALDSGFAAGTHLFNAMSGLHHRKPGLVGALLVHASAVVGLIADGVHVHPAAVRLAWQAKGPERVVLVTDATAAMGTRPGQARLGPTAIETGDGAARDHRGVLAGGTLPLDRAVRNLMRFTGCSIEDAIRAAATTPARLIGEDRRGWLGEGAVADVVLLDERFRVAATIVGGRIAYLRDFGRAAVPG
jgi:N-acetylglucosamine-6-phosphate deacetylase